MSNEPILIEAPGRMRDVERAAANDYRAKYPGGPAWLELDVATRGIWINHMERAAAALSTNGSGHER